MSSSPWKITSLLSRMFILLPLIAVLSWSWTWRIEKIECSWLHQACPPELTTQLAVLQGSQLLNPQMQHQLNTLLVAQGWQLAAWRITPPGTLRLQLVQQPTAYMIELSDQTRYLVDITGHAVVLSNEPESLPKLVVSINQDQLSKFHSNNRIEKNFDQTLQKIASHPQTAEWKIVMTNAGLRTQVNGREVLFLAGDPQVSEKYILIDQELQREGAPDTTISVIDLRFRLPVLKTGSLSTQ
jgi:hypothetical protein